MRDFLWIHDAVGLIGFDFGCVVFFRFGEKKRKGKGEQKGDVFLVGADSSVVSVRACGRRGGVGVADVRSRRGHSVFALWRCVLPYAQARCLAEKRTYVHISGDARNPLRGWAVLKTVE